MGMSAFGVEDHRLSKAAPQMRSGSEIDDLAKPLSVLPSSGRPGWRRPRSIFADEAAPAAAKPRPPLPGMPERPTLPVKAAAKQWVNPAAGGRKAAFHLRTAGLQNAAKVSRARGLGAAGAAGAAALAVGGYALGHRKSSLDQ